MLHEQSKPFILKYAMERVDSSTPPLGGHYCEIQHVWVDDESNTPVIDMLNNNYAELMTKTNIQVESDDNSYSLEMITRSRVNGESDDNSYSLEMITTTKVKVESDDIDNDFSSVGHS